MISAVSFLSPVAIATVMPPSRKNWMSSLMWSCSSSSTDVAPRMLMLCSMRANAASML